MVDYKCNYSGFGVGVAVLDTGIYAGHLDLCSRIAVFRDFVSFRKDPYDDNGHGTHVAGIIGGDGAASGGRFTGIAPRCHFIALKVLDRFGNGRKEVLLQAFDWILANRELYNIRVVNISVGTTCRTACDNSLLIEGVERLWNENLVVVAAAGNQGPRPGSITAPGSSRKVITVGSSDMLTGKKAVSGRGPTSDCVCKPDIVVPGNKIVSCGTESPAAYGIKSGTSMSTPVISGACALMLEKEPTLSNVEIKRRLLLGADDLGYNRNIQGWGKFNLKRFMETL